MSPRPQQPEVSRSRHTPLEESQRARKADDTEPADVEGSPDAVPDEAQPGHDHGEDPDKPSPERFRRRLAGEE